MFIPIRFKTNVQVGPHELVEKIDKMLYTKLQNTLEGVCSRFGYIKPNSIEILRRSAGMFVKQHFNGYLRYDIICKAEVCNPTKGMVLTAVVKNKNALGVLAEASIEVAGKDVPIIDIIIPRKAAGVASEVNLDTLNINDSVQVEVVGKRYQLNDPKISIIGRAVNQQPTAPEEIIDPTLEQVEQGSDDDAGEELAVSDEEDETESNMEDKQLDLYTDAGLIIGDDDDEDADDATGGGDADFSDGGDFDYD